MVNGLGGLDMTTTEGKVMVTLLAAFAEWERDLISRRTREGVVAARTKGVRLVGLRCCLTRWCPGSSPNERGAVAWRPFPSSAPAVRRSLRAVRRERQREAACAVTAARAARLGPP
ncbi:recombinase family protein [Planotetraspora silvatica]|uniref:recombinase family protein n=1 Tax=Planotetraspora silvatica TaxID=234614 RepID=UPI0031E1481B